METDSSKLPAFDPRCWRKAPFFWGVGGQESSVSKNHSDPGHIFSTTSCFTANEAMFGYTQPGYSSASPAMSNRGIDVVRNNFPISSTNDRWFDVRGSVFDNTVNQRFGTSIQFQPVIKSDGLMNQKCRFQTITSMPEYRDKSFEELRLEDYIINRQYARQVRSNDFTDHEYARKEMSFFDALLSNKSSYFHDRFFPQNDFKDRVNVMDDAKYKCGEVPLFGNPNFLLEHLLNHVKHRLNVNLVSDDARNACEKLTTKLFEYTEKTLASLMVVVLEDIVKNIKVKTEAPVTGVFPSPASKTGENEPTTEVGLAANHKWLPKSKVNRRDVQKSDCRAAGGGASGCCSHAAARPPKSEASGESDDDTANVCSDASSVAAENRCCATRRRPSPKKRRDRSRLVECRCDARKKALAAVGVGDGGGGDAGVKICGGRKTRHIDHGEREVTTARRTCSTRCPKGKRTTAKSLSHGCQMGRRSVVPDADNLNGHRHHDDVFCIRQRLQNVSVDTDDVEEGERDEETVHDDGDKLAGRCKGGRSDGRHGSRFSGGVNVVLTEECSENVEKGAPLSAPIGARSVEGTDESDFSSV